MAIAPKDRYPAQVDISDLVGYPRGKAQNIVSPGDGTGTPWEKDLVNDIFGMQQALLANASLVPSGTPDKVGASQYLTALQTLGDQRVNLHVVDNEWTYVNGAFVPTPKQRVIEVHFIAPEMNLAGTTALTYNSALTGSFNLTSHVATVPIARFMRAGCVLTRVDVLVTPVAARAVQTDRMRLQIFKRTIDWVTPAMPADTQVGLDTYDNGNNVLQVIALSGLNETVAADEDIRVHLRSGVNAGDGDQVHRLRLSFDDPGPRNA